MWRALERRLPVPVLGREVFPTTCPCRQERIEKERKEAEARQHQIVMDANRGVCFHEKRMREWNFDYDDGSTPAMDKAREYVAHWSLMRNEGIGLLLWGGVGTGKTYMAACIANALIDQERRVLMTDFATISNILDCQHFFRQIFLGYFSDIVQAFDTLRKNVCGDDYTSLHNPIVLSSVLPAYGMFHSIQILFL